MANESWAEIRANGRVMRYQRSRPAVIVIGPRIGVVVPDLAEPGQLAGFIEGLGARDLTILAAGAYYDAALELAERDPERIKGVSPLAG
jgi:hypothetical protein